MNAPPDATNVVPLQPKELQALLSDASFRWWIAGGWALDLFLGEQKRPHFDIDVVIARRDQGAAQQHLAKWDFHYALRIGDDIVLRTWEPQQMQFDTAWQTQTMGRSVRAGLCRAACNTEAHE